MSWCYFQESPDALRQASNLFREFLVRAIPDWMRLHSADISKGAYPVWYWLICAQTNSTGFNSGAQVGKRQICRRGCFSINACVFGERWILWLSQTIMMRPFFSRNNCFKNSIVCSEHKLQRKERTLNRILRNVGLSKSAPNKFKRWWWFKLVRACGVCPRGDQLRFSGETKQKPLSSINTSVAFRSRHFFLPAARHNAPNAQPRRPLVGLTTVALFGNSNPCAPLSAKCRWPCNEL